MKILYIAYSCSPYHGSEDAIGWNVSLQCAKSGNEVFVITKEEQRVYVERYLKENTINNLHFYYVDIPAIYKTIFKGPLYSGRLNIWHKRAFLIAKRLCEEYNVEVIHQITPIEFRSIGDYGKISNVKFVCGPIGGGEQSPKGLAYYSRPDRAIEIIRSTVNDFMRTKLNLGRTFSFCDYLLFANHETHDYLRPCVPQNLPYRIFSDVSIDEMYISRTDAVHRKTEGKCIFLVVGRLVNRKGHSFLFDALSQIPDCCDYQCYVYGDGPLFNKLEEHIRAKGLKNKVELKGSVPHIEITAVYEKADVLIVPSLREATGSVILEGMAAALPVITIDRFGGALVIDETCGWLYDGENREEYVTNLADAITECINNPDEVRRRGENARKRAAEFSWERRIALFEEIYRLLYEGKTNG